MKRFKKGAGDSANNASADNAAPTGQGEGKIVMKSFAEIMQQKKKEKMMGAAHTEATPSNTQPPDDSTQPRGGKKRTRAGKLNAGISHADVKSSNATKTPKTPNADGSKMKAPSPAAKNVKKNNKEQQATRGKKGGRGRFRGGLVRSGFETAVSENKGDQVTTTSPTAKPVNTPVAAVTSKLSPTAKPFNINRSTMAFGSGTQPSIPTGGITPPPPLKRLTTLPLLNQEQQQPQQQNHADSIRAHKRTVITELRAFEQQFGEELAALKPEQWKTDKPVGEFMSEMEAILNEGI